MPLNPAPVQQPPIQNGLFGQQWVVWFKSLVSRLSVVNNDNTISPVSLADADAPDNSIYYSLTSSKLVYKDAGGTAHVLY